MIIDAETARLVVIAVAAAGYGHYAGRVYDHLFGDDDDNDDDDDRDADGAMATDWVGDLAHDGAAG
jgi:hypothetical protein